jgi:hypothetical protein
MSSGADARRVYSPCLTREEPEQALPLLAQGSTLPSGALVAYWVARESESAQAKLLGTPEGNPAKQIMRRQAGMLLVFAPTSTRRAVA